MFEWLLRAGDGAALEASPDVVRMSPANWIAPWRLDCRRTRAEFIRGDWPAATRLIETLTARAQKAYPGFRWLPSALRALAAAYQGGAVPSPRPPRVASLFNLAAVFAAMEATAIAGVQAEAQDWLHWSHNHLPARVETAIEWPVARRRVEGLLRLRAGDVKGAVEHLRGAIEWGSGSGYVVEAAIARIQLAEVLTHARSAPRSDRLTRRLREAGWSTLREAGIDPLPYAYAATRAAGPDGDKPRPVLTPREVEVLGLLATGASYREIGARLGLSWRSAQSHAYHIYEKLDVDRKLHAVARARELGILA